MRLLIDTHALLWFCEGSSSLSDAAKRAMEDESNERYVSHATVWEVAIKLGLGKLQLRFDFQTLFSHVLDANGFTLLAPEVEHYETLIALPRHHGDPFDRLIIAQARMEKLTIVTCDGHFMDYQVPLFW